jgi:MerR family transcriptional regulator, light-induced transcriptional regulator
MNAFTIKDLENLSGIKAHTIRIWEQRYSFLKPERTGTNIRHYRNEELKTLLNIALLNRYGFKISHIDKMTPEMIREKILTLSNAEAHQERLINDLLHYMVDLDTIAFEMLLENYIQTNGIDKTLSYLLFPFLKRIGILWVTDHVRVAQEHLVSNIIRQKMIMGIQRAHYPTTHHKTVVLFLPEGEHHEIGLLYVHYILKSRGITVLYLGANVPIEDLEYLCRMKKADVAYTHLTGLPVKFNLEKYLTQLHSRMKETPIVISGEITHSYLRKIPPGISLKKTLEDVITTLTA